MVTKYRKKLVGKWIVTAINEAIVRHVVLAAMVLLVEPVIAARKMQTAALIVIAKRKTVARVRSAPRSEIDEVGSSGCDRAGLNRWVATVQTIFKNNQLTIGGLVSRL